jgi:hypothetical protein
LTRRYDIATMNVANLVRDVFFLAAQT